MSFTRWKSPYIEAAKIYLKNDRFTIWYDSGQTMRRLSVEEAEKQRLIKYDNETVSFGGQYFSATITIKNSKVRISIN